MIFYRYPQNIHFGHPNETTILLPWISDSELECLEDTQVPNQISRGVKYLFYLDINSHDRSVLGCIGVSVLRPINAGPDFGLSLADFALFFPRF